MPIDMSAATRATPPPRKSAPRKTAQAAQTPPPAPTMNQKRTEGLMGLGQLIQFGLVAFGQHADAGAIGQHYPPFAVEVANLADEYPSVAKPIDLLIEIGPFAAVIATGLPLVLQLAANHKMVDASSLAGHGIVAPEVLEAQMKAQTAKMRTAALIQQREAEREQQQMIAEYEKMMADESATLAT